MKILVLCTGNSCRSQMAEGILKELLDDSDTVYSAGTAPQGVNPKAIAVMGEVGIDISGNSSTNIAEYLDESFDFVITVCDNAAKNCPSFPGAGKKIHMPFDDPADASGSEEEILTEFRRVRNEIKERMIIWVKSLKAI